MATYTATPTSKVSVASGQDEHLLDSSNPYLAGDGEPLLPRLDSRIHIPEDIVQKAHALERMLCPVKFICVVDFTMNAYYFFINPIIGGLLCAVSFNGYLATIYFKRSLFVCYLAYQYMQVIGRLGVFVLSIDFAVQRNAINGTTDNTTLILHMGSPPGNPVLLGALFVLQAYVAYFVTRFYCTLPTRADLDRVGFVPL